MKCKCNKKNIRISQGSCTLVYSEFLHPDLMEQFDECIYGNSKK